MNFESLEAVSEKLQERKISSLNLTRLLIETAKLTNPTIGAYSCFLFETALAEAKASDQRRDAGNSRGLLDGVPIAIKDLVDTTPAFCAAGLEHLSNYQPLSDAVVVKVLRDAGAVIIGVTATDPSAFSTDTPQVINSLAPHRSVGGSSGGSGAAIVSGMAYAAIGTDTGGSIHIPAACCSVCGFKPTWGRVDATGVRPLAETLDHVGPLARCVTDLQIIGSYLDPEYGDFVKKEVTGPIALGVADDYYSDAEYGVKHAVAQAIDTLRSNAISVRAVQVPMPDEVTMIQRVILQKEAADYHIRNFPDDWANYPDTARSTIESGRGYSIEDYRLAEQQRSTARGAVDTALKDVDAILLPTLPIDAPLREADSYKLGGKEIKKLYATVRYTSLFNLTGHPVVSMPAIKVSDDRSFSIQLVGCRDNDGYLLAIARKLEHLFSVKIDYSGIMEKRADEAEIMRKKLGPTGDFAEERRSENS